MAIAEELKLVVKAEVNKAVADMRRFNTTAQQSRRGVSNLMSTIGKWVLGMGAAVLSIQALRKGMQLAFEAT